MRTLLAAFLALLALSTSAPAFAVSASGVGVQVKYSTTTVGTTNWVTIVANTSRAIKGISIFNSSPDTIEIGTTGQSAVANTETRQMVVPGALSSVGAPGATFYPMVAGQSTRISLRKLASTATTGEADFTLYYN